MFTKKLTPKKDIFNFAQMLYPDSVIEILGNRVLTEGKYSYFVSSVLVNGKLIVTGRHRKWRLSYKDLAIQLSKQSIF